METIYFAPKEKVTLTRGERFSDARMQHLSAERRSIHAVSDATGVSVSMISALEDDEIKRDVGYSNVAKLAEYYHVSADWLLGLTEEPRQNPPAVDDLHLTSDAVRMIQSFALCREELAIFSSLVSSVEFWRIIQEVKDLQTFYKRRQRDATIENEIIVRSKATKAQRQLEKETHEPSKVLVSEEFVEYTKFNICKKIEQLIEKQFDLGK